MKYGTIGGALLALAAGSTVLPLGANERSPGGRDGLRLLGAIEAVVRADYRGDRAALARGAETLASLPARPSAAHREYWIGFAYWRRAINGFNESPPAGDLGPDLERCVSHARAALALDPAFEDARGMLAGCTGALLAPAVGTAPERRAALMKEGVAVLETVRANADGNPRSLWIVGGFEAWAASQRGGELFERALATYRRGLAAARAETLAASRPAPWHPRWGAPELLMSLANLHATGPAPDARVARAYAESALAMVPDWRYVRDVLMPQIDKLAAPKSAPDGGAASVP